MMRSYKIDIQLQTFIHNTFSTASNERKRGTQSTPYSMLIAQGSQQTVYWLKLSKLKPYCIKKLDTATTKVITSNFDRSGESLMQPGMYTQFTCTLPQSNSACPDARSICHIYVKLAQSLHICITIIFTMHNKIINQHSFKKRNFSCKIIWSLIKLKYDTMRIR